MSFVGPRYTQARYLGCDFAQRVTPLLQFVPPRLAPIWWLSPTGGVPTTTSAPTRVRRFRRCLQTLLRLAPIWVSPAVEVTGVVSAPIRVRRPPACVQILLDLAPH